MIYLAIRLAAQFVSQFPGTIGLGVDSLNLLTDAQMREFIVNGFVTVQTDFPPEFHASVRAQAESIFSTEGNPGNDILPRIPELAELFAHPAVTGALTSILGPGYAMHAHRHCHLTPPRQPAQRQLQDSYEDDRNVRHHRTRWAMAFYYPQDVPPAMGPTSVLPASQYYTSRSQPERQEESVLCGAAGTVTIVHYDLWHRAATNRSDRNRCMMKFLFCRMSEPTEPSWNCHDPSRRPQFGGAAIPELCRSVWNWYLGHCRHGTGQTTSAGSVDDARPVGGGNHAVSGSEAGDAGREGKPYLSEADRLQEMYRLSAGGQAGLAVLMAALAAEADTFLGRNLAAQHTNPCQLYAGFGLSAQGAVAVSPLLKALGADRWPLRAAAADILGDIGLAAKPAVPHLLARLDDHSEWVRRNAVEALGVIAAAEAVPRLARLLTTEECDSVRHNAALSLAKIGAEAGRGQPGA